MSLNNTPSGERLHIAFFGRRNAGKSSLVNAVTGQELAVVSDVKGTTTDPVKKAMELLPMGPVVIIDTPGYDDEGDLGELRVKKTKQILAETDIAVLVVDGCEGIADDDRKIIAVFEEKKIPFITVYTKNDLGCAPAIQNEREISVSAKSGAGIHELKEKIAKLGAKAQNTKVIVADLVEEGDIVVLVIPIDEAAPKGRIILPQQMVLRELLDCHAIGVCCQDTDLASTLAALGKKPKLVITDSQAFGRVSKIVPEDIMLTSFSILMARYKGDLETLVKGAAMLGKLKDGDRVLISEGCTHHRQCGDIGSVKLPAWIKKFCGAEPEFSFTSGGEFTENPEDYKVIVHCGGCMLNEAVMKSRIDTAVNAEVPIVNYGVAIAHIHGILKQSLAPFPSVAAML